MLRSQKLVSKGGIQTFAAGCSEVCFVKITETFHLEILSPEVQNHSFSRFSRGGPKLLVQTRAVLVVRGHDWLGGMIMTGFSVLCAVLNIQAGKYR